MSSYQCLKNRDYAQNTIKSSAWLLLILVCIAPVFTVSNIAARDDCPVIRTTVPRSNPDHWCYEELWRDETHSVMGVTALAWWQGNLYGTRPLEGQLIALDDVNLQTPAYQSRIVAQGLTRPNALHAHPSGLYITAHQHIYRLNPDETLDVLLDDVPAGTGLWTGGIALYDTGEQRWLLVGTSAPCEGCAFDATTGRGAIWAYALQDGHADAGRIIAHGLRYPASLLVLGDDLWVTDSASWALIDTIPYADELNRLSLPDMLADDAQPPVHLGYPYCVGAQHTPDERHNPQGQAFDCSQTIPPRYVFDTASLPIATHFYPHHNNANIADSLLIAFAGSVGTSAPRGYAIIALTPHDATPQAHYVIPYDETDFFNDITLTPDGQAWRVNTDNIVYWNGVQIGFFPNRLYGLTGDETGTLYFTWGNHKLLRLSPDETR